MEGTLIAARGAQKLRREQLVEILPPEATATHQPIAHHALVTSLIEGLDYRHIAVVNDEYAVTADGMKLFGLLELENGFDGARYALGVRNANDKSMRLAMTVGFFQ
jgi:hypothetical protein